MKSMWTWLAVALVLVPFAVADEHEGKRRGKHDGGDLDEILEGLEHGMVALERLDRRRELEMLERVANDVRKELAERRRRREREHEEDPERKWVGYQIRALHASLDAFDGKKDERSRRAAEMIEQAIHSREAALKGRRVEGPSKGNVIELLMWSAKLLEKQRKGDSAEFVGGVARRMQEAWKRRRAGERDRGGSELRERVERLERRVEKLANIIERLIDELEDDDDRDRDDD